MSNQAQQPGKPAQPDETTTAGKGAQSDASQAAGPDAGSENAAGAAGPSPQPEAPAGAEAAGANASLEQLLADTQAKMEAQREAALRAVAEADNVRKRAQMEVATAQKFAAERIAEALLPLADSLDAALAADNASLESLRSGVEVTRRQLLALFERERVSEVSPAPGERFDPHRHQAMAAVESDAEPNTVVAVLQKGWRLHDRVLRPALVTVAKPRSANDA